MLPTEKDEQYTLLQDVDMGEMRHSQYHDETPTVGSSRPNLDPLDTSPPKRESILRYARAAKNMRLVAWLVWMRWGVILTMQILIMFALLWHHKSDGWTPKDTETGGDVNGMYVPHSHKFTLLEHEPSKYMPNMSSNIDRMEIRDNWSKLLPLGSGTVRIPHWEQYPMLGTPITDDPIRSGPIFETAWTHALHCLYYSVDTYHQLVISGGQKFGLKGARNDWHSAHCFEYLRLNILCMADMTLEGAHSVLDPEGEGTAHMCRDKKEVWDWLEERRVDDLRSITVGLTE